MRIAPEGWVVIVPFVVVAAIIGGLAAYFFPTLGYIVTGVCVLLILWCLWFFRDPSRTPDSTDADAVISPADARILKVHSAPMPAELGMGGAPCVRVCMFLNVFNVHVNRTPSAGVIEKVVYTKGQFVSANLDKASTDNERSVVLLRDGAGRHIAFAQIAGLVARRIVNHLKAGQRVALAERYGLIRFGSRAEVFMPVGTVVSVKPGDFVRCGQTVIARLPTVAVVTTSHASHQPSAASA